MNFLIMKYFIAVAEHRNITKAARSLHITQQTLSAHIAALERELGAKLLVRKTPLELTYAGEVFLRYALSFSDDLRGLRNEFADISGNQRGRIRVGVAHTRGYVMMPPALALFRSRFPQVEVIISESTNGDLFKKLHERELDVVIGRTSSSQAGVTSRVLVHEEMVLLVPNAFPVDAASGFEALAKLEDAPFLMSPPEDIAGEESHALFETVGITPRIAVQAENIATLLDLCACGVGACLCPENLAKGALSKEKLAVVRVFRFGDKARYPISIAMREEGHRWSVIDDFITCLEETVGDGATSVGGATAGDGAIAANGAAGAARKHRGKGLS